MKKLHLIGYSLHENECLLRHVFKIIKGETKTGQFSGYLGNLLCENYVHAPQIEFVKIKREFGSIFDDSVIDDLSSDQRLLLESVEGIAAWQVASK